MLLKDWRWSHGNTACFEAVPTSKHTCGCSTFTPVNMLLIFVDVTTSRGSISHSFTYACQPIISEYLILVMFCGTKIEQSVEQQPRSILLSNPILLIIQLKLVNAKRLPIKGVLKAQPHPSRSNPIHHHLQSPGFPPPKRADRPCVRWPQPLACNSARGT